MRILFGILVLALTELLGNSVDFQQVKFEIQDLKSPASVTIIIADTGSGTLTAVSSDGSIKRNQVKITQTQLDTLDQLLEDADIATINSQIASTKESLPIKIKITVKTKNKTYSTEANLNNYDSFQDRLDPLVKYFLFEKFQAFQKESF